MKMKRVFALMVSAMMVVSIVGCGASDDKSTEIDTTAAEETTKVEKDTDSDDVTTVTFWHHRGSGVQYDCVTHAVETFNSTIGAEKGIVVEEAYIGNYADLYAQTSLAIQSGDAPNIVSCANTYVPYLLEDGALVNMAEFDGADEIRNNLMDWVLEIGGNTNGDLYSLPYCRSTPLFYYNKDIADELGIKIGETITIDELEAFMEAATVVESDGTTSRYGFELLNDFGYYNGAWIYQLGSEYMSENGGSPSLEDGTMKRVLSDWRSWVDAGWCRPFDSTEAGDTMHSMFYNGEIASFCNSCAGLSTALAGCKETGVNLGVAQFPTYDENNAVAEIGGAQVEIIGCDNSEEEVEASWEFVKFLMSDEEQYYNSMTSGYVPATLSIAEYDDMVAFWEEKPEFKVAYNQMLNSGRAQELPFLAVGQDFTQICSDTVSLLIAEQSITAEEAAEKITTESEIIW